jgi:hypothetical protein
MVKLIFVERGKVLMLEKVLFWGIVISFGLVVLCFLIITVSAIIFGYGDSITSNPDNSRLEDTTAFHAAINIVGWTIIVFAGTV